MLAKLEELLPTIFQNLKPTILVFMGGGGDKSIMDKIM